MNEEKKKPPTGDNEAPPASAEPDAGERKPAAAQSRPPARKRALFGPFVKRGKREEPFADQADLESDFAGERWETDIDTYPLRKPEEDEGWALWVARIWMMIAGFAITFMVGLIILGAIFD